VVAATGRASERRRRAVREKDRGLLQGKVLDPIPEFFGIVDVANQFEVRDALSHEHPQLVPVDYASELDACALAVRPLCKKVRILGYENAAE
jgi:hypothetical protein